METLIGRSKQPLWQVYVLLPAAALCAYMVKASYDPDFAETTRRNFLDNFDPLTRAIFFGACAAVCLVCAGLALRRRLAPRDELIIDGTGITSLLSWGKGTIAWPAIEALKFENNWMYVHGKDGAGMKKKLIVNLGGLDRAPADILSVIAGRRPDIVPVRQA
jgi:hypothetical protein